MYERICWSSGERAPPRGRGNGSRHRRRGQFASRTRQDPGLGRRVRFGQDDGRSRGSRPHPSRCADRGWSGELCRHVDVVARRDGTACSARRHRVVCAARPGVVAQPSTHHRHPVARGARRSLVWRRGRSGHPDYRDDGRGVAADRRRIPETVSTPVVWWPTATRRASHGVRVSAGCHRARRAHDRPRCFHPGARAGNGAVTRCVAWCRSLVHHPRSGGGSRSRRRRCRDVRRTRC